MRPVLPIHRAVCLVLLTTLLSGCISVFPKSEPSQLYRFGNSTGAAPQSTVARVGVLRSGGSFALAAAGDGILTTTGTEVAYLAGARWAQPAPVLFDEALARAFSRNPGAAQLVVRGEPARAAYSLRIDVQSFEAVYNLPGKSPPEVTLGVHVVVVRASDRAIVADQTVSVAERASDNRVTAIVAAFDRGVGKALTEVVRITNEAVAS